MDKNKKMKVIADEEDFIKGEEKDFKDILDALKDQGTVFDKTDYHLDSNFLLSKKADEKWQTFHTRQHIVAKKIEEGFPKIRVIKYFPKDHPKAGEPMLNEFGHYTYDYITNPFAKKAFLLVMMPSNDWAILNRNDPDNVMLNGILKWGDSSKEIITQEEQTGGQGILPKKLTQFFKKKDQERVVVG